MTNSKETNRWNIALWVAQAVLGLMFLMAGAMKLFQPITEIAASIPWVSETPALLVRFIGLSEFLGAVGLILPAALRIQPQLTRLAAMGLSLVMILAMGFHLFRGEMEALPINFMLFGLAAFIAWGRTKKAPISPK